MVSPLALWDLLTTWILPFVVVFGTIVLVHEAGHYLVARRVGIKVYEFAIGFGKALVQWKRGETVYSVRLLPLGGFVKLAGMDAAVDPEEEVPEDDERSFLRKTVAQRMATIAAGPVANFLLAFVLLFSSTGPSRCLSPSATCCPEARPRWPVSGPAMSSWRWKGSESPIWLS
jgi:Predicted membrane-associated Zn-dependent proteases 1